jgi:RNA polymerase sigma-70 factor (sigma-E family)
MATSGARRVDFEEFLDREWDGLARYSLLLADSRHQAEDLLAEALAKAHRRWTRIQSMQYPLAYVRRILTTTAVSNRRAWETRHVHVTPSGALPEIFTGGDEYRAVDEREQVGALLAGLPPRQRAAVVLRYLLECSDEEIATEMRCSTSAVRSYISRGLAALRAADAAAR